MISLLSSLLFINLCFSKFIYVPNLGLVNLKCVKKIPTGTLISRKRDKTILYFPNGKNEIIPNCSKDEFIVNELDEDPWKGYTEVPGSLKNISTFLSTMVVPETPKSHDGDILYIFPAIQNVDWKPGHGPHPTIFNQLQGVLQYNYDGSETWDFSIWYTSANQIFTTEYIVDLKPGDEVVSNFTVVVNLRAYLHNIYANSEVNGENRNITIYNTFLDLMQYAYTTVEQYGDISANSLPRSDLVFKDMRIFNESVEVTKFKWESHKYSEFITKIEIDGTESTTFSFQKHEKE